MMNLIKKTSSCIDYSQFIINHSSDMGMVMHICSEPFFAKTLMPNFFHARIPISLNSICDLLYVCAKCTMLQDFGRMSCMPY